MLAVRLVLEVVDGAAARAATRVVPMNVATAPASSLGASATAALGSSGSLGERNAPPETGGISATSSPSASAVVAVGVLLVDRVEEAARLVAEPELRPDVGDARRRRRARARDQPGALAQPGEEAHRDAHLSNSTLDGPDGHVLPLGRRGARAPRRPCRSAARTSAASARSSGPTGARLSGLLALIVLSAALGVVPAFLLKRVLEAIGRNDTPRALAEPPPG